MLNITRSELTTNVTKLTRLAYENNTLSQKQKRRKKYFNRTTAALPMRVEQMPIGQSTELTCRGLSTGFLVDCRLLHHNELHFQVSRNTMADARSAVVERPILLAKDGEPK